jgi:RecA-family ATPase
MEALDVISRWTVPACVLSGPPPATDWLINGWLQSTAAGTICAPGATGKTTLLIDLCVSIATGLPFLGRAVERPGSTVLISLEDDLGDLLAVWQEVVRTRVESNPDLLERCRIGNRLFSHVTLQQRPTFATHDGRMMVPTAYGSGLIERLREIPDLRLIVLDTLRLFAGGDLNDSVVASVVTSEVTKIAKSLRCAVMLSHHMPKAVATGVVASGQYSASGSAAIVDNLRFAWTLMPASKALSARTGTKAYTLTSTRGALMAERPQPIHITRQGFTFSAIPSETSRPAPGQDLSAHLPCTFARAVELIGGRLTDARKSLNARIEAGELRVTGRGVAGDPKMVHLVSSQPLVP